jgi:aminopeptidase N
VLTHEVAHEWFPMMVGQDEAAYAWMDEGFTTYHEAMAFNDYFRDADHWVEPRMAYLSVAGNKLEAPLMRHADQMDDAAMGIAAYYKPGTLLRSLRAVIGEQAFDQAMRTYAREWLLKHPQPWDWFNTMERVSGRDLDWFFYPWFFRTATFDQGISSVTQGSGTVTVTVRDLGQVPGPTYVSVTTANGQTVMDTIPVERWLSPATRSQSVTISVPGPATRVELDPRQFFPDANRRNNVWTGS